MVRKTTARTKAKTLPPATESAGGNDLLTRAQLECLEAWFRLYEATGKEPTTRAVSAELGLVDNGAAPRIRQLDKKGVFARVIIPQPGPRELTEVGKRWLSLARRQLAAG